MPRSISLFHLLTHSLSIFFFFLSPSVSISTPMSHFFLWLVFRCGSISITDSLVLRPSNLRHSFIPTCLGPFFQFFVFLPWFKICIIPPILILTARGVQRGGFTPTLITPGLHLPWHPSSRSLSYIMSDYLPSQLVFS